MNDNIDELFLIAPAKVAIAVSQGADRAEIVSALKAARPDNAPPISEAELEDLAAFYASFAAGGDNDGL